MSAEQLFNISVTDDELALLKRKLENTRLPDEVNRANGTTAYRSPTSDGSLAHSRMGTTGARTNVS
jgi:hypothetical protein